jgi:hypothetical protein
VYEAGLDRGWRDSVCAAWYQGAAVIVSQGVVRWLWSKVLVMDDVLEEVLVGTCRIVTWIHGHSSVIDVKLIKMRC